ncbi:MAG TPA: TonB family protein [Pyrinomonadaceae bacterium]|nr:TonB family protein [Pyrinomonadaceae bacterium]
MQDKSFGISQYFTAFIFLIFVFFPTSIKAQSSTESSQPADVVQSRIGRARALVAAHQLETAATELESVRATTQDSSIHNIASVMLMNIYLEAGNYGRAEALLDESFRSRGDQSGGNYFALAGQALIGARAHLARYRSLGINTSATNLPAEALTDLDRLRSFLERMIVHAKEISTERRAYDSLSLLEDVLGIRLSLSRDSEEQAKWNTEYSGARDLLVIQSQVASRTGITALPVKASAIKTPSPYSTRRPNEEADTKAANENKESGLSASSAPATKENAATDKLTDFGLLNFKASKRVLPRYPPIAKQMGTSGLVRVHVIVDEKGKVVEVSRTEGPLLLRQVAEDAARGWYFEGIAGPGQTVRFTGYIDFNFTL